MGGLFDRRSFRLFVNSSARGVHNFPVEEAAKRKHSTNVFFVVIGITKSPVDFIGGTLGPYAKEASICLLAELKQPYLKGTRTLLRLNEQFYVLATLHFACVAVSKALAWLSCARSRERPEFKA